MLPYIGDLIGYRSLHPIGPDQLTPRAEVANTIGYRRRKGTASVLEQLARDVTGWNARAVEFFQLLATTQYMNHIRLTNFYAPDLRQWEPLERLGHGVRNHGAHRRRPPRRTRRRKIQHPEHRHFSLALECLSVAQFAGGPGGSIIVFFSVR